MKVLGMRASTSEIRYAILAKSDDGTIVFVNKDMEHKLVYPAGIDNIEQKLKWLKDEMLRVVRQNPDICKIVIKMNEYTGTENGAKRETTYADAIFLLVAAENNIPIERKLYNQIGASSRDVKEKADHYVGKTGKYWNKQIADAIQCAFWEIQGM